MWQCIEKDERNKEKRSEGKERPKKEKEAHTHRRALTTRVNTVRFSLRPARNESVLNFV